MPNWVYNTVTIEGEAKELKAFKKQAGKSVTGSSVEFVNGEAVQKLIPVTDCISFMNFLAPAKKILDEYHALADGRTRSANNWYEWNIRNWNTKWDACQTELNESQKDELTYTFNTAWDVPTPVFVEMARQHPLLTFTFRSVEEQGWGTEYTGEDGELMVVDTWDIPTSHAEYEKHQGECPFCTYPEDWDDNEAGYVDCPTRPNDKLTTV